MKKILTLLITLHLSCHVFAQSGTLIPDGFILPNLAEAPACTVDDKGKLYYNTTTSTMMVCDGVQWLVTSSIWGSGGAPNTININGRKVGIGTSTPEYVLDVNGTARITNNLLVGSKISIGTTALNSALTIADGDIAITSTADAKIWKFDYNDDNDNLSILENGVPRMIFMNDGNVGIGAATPIAKLSVDGTGYFSGNLTVNGGKGIVRTSTAASMKLHVAEVNLGASFSILAGNCATSSSINISAADFSSAPTAQVGNLVSGSANFGKLVVNVQSATSTSFIVRFCNNTTSNISLVNTIFNVLCIGQ